jgi:ATP-binding cassette subfamily F protein 2
MVSASKAARDAKRAAEGKAPKKTVASRSKAGSKTASGASSVAGDETPPLDQDVDEPATSAKKMDEVKRLADQMDKHGLSDRVTTGVLSSLKQSRDVKITSVSLVFHGRVLITDKREFPIPDHVDIYLLNEGAPPSDLGALEWVVREAENEMERLDKEAERILEEDGPESPLLMDLYEVCCFHPALIFPC